MSSTKNYLRSGVASIIWVGSEQLNSTGPSNHFTHLCCAQLPYSSVSGPMPTLYLSLNVVRMPFLNSSKKERKMKEAKISYSQVKFFTFALPLLFWSFFCFSPNSWKCFFLRCKEGPHLSF